jgi:hypothetical protein
VALRLRRPATDDERDDQQADGGKDDDEGVPQEGEGALTAVEEEPVREADQVAEEDRPETSDETHADGEDHGAEVLGP